MATLAAAADRNKMYYDENIREYKPKPGDQVLLRQFEKKPLQRNFRGPVRIVEVTPMGSVKLEDIDGANILGKRSEYQSVEHIRPFRQGVPIPATTPAAAEGFAATATATGFAATTQPAATSMMPKDTQENDNDPAVPAADNEIIREPSQEFVNRQTATPPTTPLSTRPIMPPSHHTATNRQEEQQTTSPTTTIPQQTEQQKAQQQPKNKQRSTSSSTAAVQTQQQNKPPTNSTTAGTKYDDFDVVDHKISTNMGTNATHTQIRIQHKTDTQISKWVDLSELINKTDPDAISVHAGLRTYYQNHNKKFKNRPLTFLQNIVNFISM